MMPYGIQMQQQIAMLATGEIRVRMIAVVFI